MNTSWEDLRLFLAVAETGSFSAAARSLKTSQPTLSRRISALEVELGEALFQRSAEGVTRTAAGERLLPAARSMAEWAAEAGRAAAGGERAIEGVVRIAAPPGFAFEFLAPFAAHLRKVHPGLRLSVLAGVEYLNLSRGEAELAIRVQRPSQRDLTCLAEITLPTAAFATPEYARKLGKKYTFADVDWITWAPPHDNLPPTPQLAALIPDFRPVFTSNDLLVQWHAAEAGVGAFVMSRVEHRFSRSKLVELTLDLGPYARSSFCLVGVKSVCATPRVKAVIDLLLVELGQVASSA
jgi:DNA-binding transcriptional LysR family regulator